MPIYEYRCDECEERFEEFLSLSTKPAPPCPKCGSKKVDPAVLADQHRVAAERRGLGPRRPQLGLGPFQWWSAFLASDRGRQARTPLQFENLARLRTPHGGSGTARGALTSAGRGTDVPFAEIDEEVSLYYELTGPEDGPVVLQLGGGLFGRHNFGLVNDGFRERGFRLLSFDARGYGASSCPREVYTIEGWAADGAALLDAVGLDRVLVHGTSMGGMIAIAFTALHPERTIAACADVAFAKPDLYRRTVFRVWRRMAEEMAWDEFSDHVTTQAVGARFMESPEGENIFQLVRDIVGLNDPYTVRQACLAMENMDSPRSSRGSSGPC